MKLLRGLIKEISKNSEIRGARDFETGVNTLLMRISKYRSNKEGRIFRGFLEYKAKATTVVEVIVAMVIILTVITLTFTFFFRVNNNNNYVVKLRAHLLSEEIINKTKNNNEFLNNTFYFENIIIEKTLTPFEQYNDLRKLEITARTKNDRELFRKYEIISIVIKEDE